MKRRKSKVLEEDDMKNEFLSITKPRYSAKKSIKTEHCEENRSSFREKEEF